MEIRPVMKVVGVSLNLDLPEAYGISQELRLLVSRGMGTDEFPALHLMHKDMPHEDIDQAYNAWLEEEEANAGSKE